MEEYKNKKIHMSFKKSFTLVELMIVIAILAILTAIVIFTLNPSRLFDNFRDSRRVSDIVTINKAINFMETWNTNGISYGNTSIVYISLPDSSSTCSNYTLPTLPIGYSYSCKPSNVYRNSDSTGWIPLDFTISSSNRYINLLPIDPTNNNTYFYTYYTGSSYEVTSLLKNPNKNSISDDDSLTGTFTLGSPNRTWNTPLQRDSNLVAYWDFDETSGNTAYDKSGNGYNSTLSGPERTTTVGTNKAMYYDASSTDYISTPSFAIPDTGILTIEAWMKSKINTTISQTIAGDNAASATVGHIFMYRSANANHLKYYYADGTTIQVPSFPDIFLNLDNQWIHVVIVCDYANKTLKAYRNGVQFGVTQNLTGTPVFPSTNNAKFVGSYSSGSYKLTDGSLDNIRIYNRALSAEEISEIYNKTKGKYQ